MAEPAQYTPAEIAQIRDAFAAASGAASGAASESATPIVCPRCGGTMTARAIGGGSFGLGYARKREWLICTACRRSAIFDTKRGTRN